MWFLLVACTGPAPPDAPPEGSGEDTAASPSDGVAAPGPCATYTEAVSTGLVEDPALDELSGLAASRQNADLLWTHEDSGGAPVLYGLNAAGATVATLALEGVSAVDWEDLAIAPCPEGWCLTVGDIGTLGTDRAEFALLTVPEPRLDGSTVDFVATPRIRTFTWPDGAEDAEALVVTGDGTPLLFSKRDDATTGVYSLPEGSEVLVFHAAIPTGEPGEGLAAQVTAADLWPDAARLLLRTYFHLYEVDLADVDAPGPPVAVPFALEVQGEAVAWDAAQGGFWQVSEGVHPPLWFTGCAGD